MSSLYLGTLEGYDADDLDELGFSVSDLNPVKAAKKVYRAAVPKSVRNVLDYPGDKLKSAVLEPMKRQVMKVLKSKVGAFVAKQVAKHGDKAFSGPVRASILTAAGVEGAAIGGAIGAAFAGVGAIPGAAVGGPAFASLANIALDEAQAFARKKVIEAAKDLTKGKKAPSKAQIIKEAVAAGQKKVASTKSISLTQSRATLAQAVKAQEQPSSFSPWMLAPAALFLL